MKVIQSEVLEQKGLQEFPGVSLYQNKKACLIFSSRVVGRSGQHLAKWVRELLHAQLEL